MRRVYPNGSMVCESPVNPGKWWAFVSFDGEWASRVGLDFDSAEAATAALFPQIVGDAGSTAKTLAAYQAVADRQQDQIRDALQMVVDYYDLGVLRYMKKYNITTSELRVGLEPAFVEVARKALQGGTKS